MTHTFDIFLIIMAVMADGVYVALHFFEAGYGHLFDRRYGPPRSNRVGWVVMEAPAGIATDLYGLSPRWQRIGQRLGVLITADSCARRGLQSLWRGRRCIGPIWWNRILIPTCNLSPICIIRPLRGLTMNYQK